MKMVISLKNTTNKLLMVADFETTVYPGQTETEVWSAAYCELFSNEDVQIRLNIDVFLNDLFKMKRAIKCWLHNIKFDGNFIISWLLSNGYRWCNKPDYQMPTKTFKALISSKNRFYSITIRTPKNVSIEFWDSLKLIPFTLEEAGRAFNTKHKKLSMKYDDIYHANTPIPLHKKAYIINDVLVLKEIMEILINRNMNRMTIGSVCVHDYKSRFDEWEYKAMFPDLRNIPWEYNPDISTETFVRKTYKGAWCYLKEPGDYFNGATYDVNSLYSSVMHSKSGNYYPVGNPHFFKGEIPEICNKPDIIYFLHIKCRFDLRENYLPTIQIKNNLMYKSNEWLSTSKIKFRGKYYDYLEDKNGNKHDSRPDLYLTFKDWELLNLHYDVYDCEIIEGCWFNGVLGLFDAYIDEWMGRKISSTDKVERTIDKLYLNNLYGKFASSDDASYMVPYLDDDGVVQYKLEESHDKNVMYIPVGSMVTSYARYFTITHAQMNYKSFIYADTDSLHMLDNEPVGINVHPTDLLCWKKESVWCMGRFIRQKTYAECILNEKVKGDNFLLYDWNITCAGMPEKSKKEFLRTRDISDFKVGLKVGGKLVPKNIKGGVILVEREFTLKGK